MLEQAIVDIFEKRSTDVQYGGFGQRMLSNKDRIKLQDLQDKREIDRIFNNMFYKVDANPKEQFQAAFGTGTYEYEEFQRTILTIMEDDTDTSGFLFENYNKKNEVWAFTDGEDKLKNILLKMWKSYNGEI